MRNLAVGTNFTQLFLTSCFPPKQPGIKWSSVFQARRLALDRSIYLSTLCSYVKSYLGGIELFAFIIEAIRLTTFKREITVKVLFVLDCTRKCKYRAQLVTSLSPWDRLANMPCREKRKLSGI